MPDEIVQLKTPSPRLLIKVTHDSLPQVKDKYPFINLERGRLEIDDSSVKWIDFDATNFPQSKACT